MRPRKACWLRHQLNQIERAGYPFKHLLKMKQKKTSNVDSRALKAAILLAAITILTLIIQLSVPIASTDIWWHMALGKHILNSGSLIVDHSLFTWTPALSYLVYNSWLSEIILYLIDEYWGTGGLIALRYFVFLGILALGWHFSIKRSIAANPLAWLIIILSFTLMWGVNLIKPELFSLGFMSVVVWLYYTMRYAGDRGWYLPYLYPVIFALWVNIHGAFFLSSLFMAAIVVGEFLNAKFSPTQAMPGKLRIHFVISIGLCIPAIMLNPFGYELPLEIVRTALFGSLVAQDHIIAYRPTFFLNFPPLFLLDYLIASMLIFVFLIWQKLKLRKTDWVAILSYLAYCALFVQMGRVTYFLGPVFLFTALDLLAHKQRSWAWPSSKWAKYLLIVVSITCVVFVSARFIYQVRCDLANPTARIERMFNPTINTIAESANYIEKRLSGTRIGNIYEDGGYLMYRFWPQKKVMIDPRALPFPDWIDSYFEFTEGKNIQKFVRNYDADFWLINYAFPEVSKWFLASKDWSLAFIGPNGSVFVPATISTEEPEVSNKIDTLDNLPAISKMLSFAFILEDQSLIQGIYDAASSNLCKKCGNSKVYLEELDNTITGMDYYRKGDYREAANRWSKPSNFIFSQGKAADSLMKLAESDWENGDIVSARNAYLEIIILFPQVATWDAYNFAVLDWHYRHSGHENLPEPYDELHWESILSTLLDNKENLLPEEQAFIAETAQKMKAGTFARSVRLIPRDSGTPLDGE